MSAVLEVAAGALRRRHLLWQLVVRDLTAAYSGSVFGNAWAVVDPAVYVALTLFFFQFAIRGVETGGVPYVAWVLPQIIFWMYGNAVLSSSVNAVKEYGFLLRHRHFDMRLVALIKIGSAALVHAMLMAIVLMALYLFLGVEPGWRVVLLPYYFVAMCAVLLGVAWVVAALGAFWKDLRNVVSIVLQVEFWMSPIFWEPERFPKAVALIMYLNPFYYPIHGYRSAILQQDFGGHFWVMTAYFWIVAAVLVAGGSRLFVRLSEGFGDVV